MRGITTKAVEARFNMECQALVAMSAQTMLNRTESLNLKREQEGTMRKLLSGRSVHVGGYAGHPDFWKRAPSRRKFLVASGVSTFGLMVASSIGFPKVIHAETLTTMGVVRRGVFTVALMMLVFSGTALPEIWAQAVDPQSLVGKWEGTWTNISHPSSSGDYNMTVMKVDRNQVYGRTERFPTTGERRTSDFVGTLEGEQLKFGNSISSTELESIRLNPS